MTEKLYKVAGHMFSLSMPENQAEWRLLDNYRPFEVTVSADTDNRTLFRCALSQELPSGNMELFYHDEPDDDGMARIDIFRLENGFIFEMRPFRNSPSAYRLWTSRDFSEGRIMAWKENGTGRFPIDNSLMLMFALNTMPLKTLEMHASVTVRNGKGYLFLGKSGTGKSTHSRMWLENIPGCRLLNDDNPIVRVLEDGTVMVYGSPWSGKTRCYVNAEYPAGGFVQIMQYPSNIISRQNTLDSYISVYTSCSGLKMDEAMNDLLHSTIENVIEKVPCWLMKCLPDGNAARVCCTTVTHEES